MTKLEAIIQNSRLDAVKTALQEIGVEGMTVIEVRGHGRQKGHTEVYRGREYSVDLIPKTKLEMVLPDNLVEKAEQAILTAARTGKIGDGKIFRSHVDEAIRIANETDFGLTAAVFTNDLRAAWRAAEALRAATRPIIVAGGGVIYSAAESCLRAFSEATGIPVAETQAGKGAMNYDHPQAVGAIGA